MGSGHQSAATKRRARPGGSLPRNPPEVFDDTSRLGDAGMSAGDGSARSSPDAHAARSEDGSEGMRYLFIAWAAGGLGRWERRYQEERERAEALAVRLAQAESALEATDHGVGT